MVGSQEKAGAQKAIVAAIGGVIIILNTFFGTNIDLPVEEINALAVILTAGGVYYVKNKGT